MLFVLRQKICAYGMPRNISIRIDVGRSTQISVFVVLMAANFRSSLPRLDQLSVVLDPAKA